MNLENIYDANFYASTSDGSLHAARRFLGKLWDKRGFQSVVDIGCGTGTWLLAAQELGATVLKGIEGSHIPPDQFVVPRDFITRADLFQPMDHRDARFDLCLCLELAEHLPKARAEGLVQELCRLSSVILFSAATPFQGGNGHVNEMWPEYWAHLFERFGYVPWTGPRTALWTDQSIPWWYRQNALVFIHKSEWDAILPGETPSDPGMLTAIHPENYLWCVRRDRRQLATSFDFDLAQYYSSVRGDATPFGYGREFSVPVSENVTQNALSSIIVPAPDSPAPLISVIIPCYKQAQYLPQAVRSVLDQNFESVEVIVVDDGSPDEPLARLGALADDPRVRYIRQENSGVGRARNAGVTASRGTFLNFLDADDWLAPEFCERMAQRLSMNPDYAFVYCDLRHLIEMKSSDVDENYSVGGSRQLLSGNILPSLLLGGYFPPHTVLLRKSVLNQVGLFDGELAGHADWDLWLRISAAGYKAEYVDEKLVYYRIHAAGMSRNGAAMSDTRLRALRKLMTNSPIPASEAIHHLCRSVDEQYAANKFLRDQIAGIREGADWYAQAEAEHVAQDKLRVEAAAWRLEAERLRRSEERFAQYFAESQAWIASQTEAKAWQEEQTAYWKKRAERLAGSGNGTVVRALTRLRHLVRSDP